MRAFQAALPSALAMGPWWRIGSIPRHFPDRIESLVYATWRTISPLGIVERPVDGFSAFASPLGDVFQIDPPQLDAVWRCASEHSGA